MRARHDDVWTQTYEHICPPDPGMLLRITGVDKKDTYNVAVVGEGAHQILAFRCEQRKSFAWRRNSYHPVVYFARPNGKHWAVDEHIQPFDMMEDPFFFTAKSGTQTELIFGGVKIRREGHKVIPQTMFFRGPSVETLDRTPFAVIDDMKDIRLVQLPDGRFLLMRRPWGGEYGRGRITLHLLPDLDALHAAKQDLPTLATLDDCGKAADWVGINEAHILTGKDKETYVGLLGHVAYQDSTGKHYAACTYTLKLKDILNKQVPQICPHIITVRSCFIDAPAKMKGLRDVVFPGHIEQLDKDRYRLWAGLSDTRIGTIEVTHPFQLPV